MEDLRGVQRKIRYINLMRKLYGEVAKLEVLVAARV